MRWLHFCFFAIVACRGEQASRSAAAPQAGSTVESVAIHWELDQNIDEAAEYLIRHLDTSGRFDYMRRSKKRESKYNLLRHAGAIYSLQQYYAYRSRPATLSAIRRATMYLKTRYIHPIAISKSSKPSAEYLAAISLAREENLPAPTAKLGGAALALVALCGTHRLVPGIIRVEELQAIGRFILFMQRPDGSFHSKYRADAGFDREFHSLYYPGEAMLALTMLYDIDGDIKWLDAALNAAAQLVSSRQGKRKIPADHWMMLASAPLLKNFDMIPNPAVSRESLTQHIATIGAQIQKSQRLSLPAEEQLEVGSFERQARSTPTATRLEGLNALLTTQRTTGSINTKILQAVSTGLDFLRRCQIKEPGLEQGGIPRSCAHDSGIGKRDGEIRIDYVQHYMSALIAFQKNSSGNLAGADTSQTDREKRRPNSEQQPSDGALQPPGNELR